MQRHHVASGTYYHGTQQATLLSACLGTCVGVALIDEVAGVGGLIHLLLPEPMTLESTFQPEKYASNGLPLFLSVLYEAGATKQNLQAWIAGGALVGPILQRDLDLDIGGRTAEVARNLLTDAGIAIGHVETGGFFACTLSLDMQTWACTIEPIGLERSQQPDKITTLTEVETLKAIARVQPIPQVALKILRLMSDADFDVTRVAEEVRQDQVISALTLKICNSAIYARKKRIGTLEHALVYLGRDLFLRLVVTAAISDLYESSQAGYSLCKGGLFHHAVGTAAISEKIAAVTGLAEPSLAYSGGLLHDIGKVVLDQHLATAFPFFYRQAQDDGTSFMATEKEIFGMTHCDTGFHLSQNWSFPDSLATVIRHHHYPETATEYTELTHIVYLADLLMSRFHTGLELERINTGELAKRLETLNLPPSRFHEIVDLIPSSVFKTENGPGLSG